MVLRVDLEKCFEAGLTPTQFSYLFSIHQGQVFPWPVPRKQMLELEEEGWIKITPEGAEIREQFLIFMGINPAETDDVASWIEEWRNLWPTGVKSGGRLVRGDKRGVLGKMTKFVKENEFSKEEIFEATRIYLFEKAQKQYQYMTCADYFIEKNKSSTLAAFCEDVELRGNSLKATENGTNSFFKSI